MGCTLRLRAEGRVLRIGHRGAASLEPENTLRSLARAVELGVDLVEFDVLDLQDGTLVLAHSDDLLEVSHGAAAGSVRSRTLADLREVAPELPTLDEAIAFMVERAPGVGLHLDLKCPGAEASLVAAVVRHGVVERSLVSSFRVQSLREVARLEPQIARGLTYPLDRHRLSTRRPLAPVALAGLVALRQALPRRIAGLLGRADASVAVLHHHVITRAVVARCHALDVPVVAWTVDDPAVVRRLVRVGVDAIVTNDPRMLVGTLPA